MALTRRQKQVLDLIAKFVDENGYSPSYEELAQGLNLASLATVHKHISALTDQELSEARIQPEPLAGVRPQVCAGEPPPPGAAALEIPLLGRIAAGMPVEAVEQRATLSFADFVGHPGTFALEVRGESMIGDHICDGDMVWSSARPKCETAKSW